MSTHDIDIDSVYCGAIKRGDIFLVKNHHHDQVVVVVQDDILNERLDTVLAIPVEPVKAGDVVFKNEIVLTKKETSFGKSGLCKPYRIMPVDRHYMASKRGELSKNRLLELLACIDVNLGRFRDN